MGAPSNASRVSPSLSLLLFPSLVHAIRCRGGIFLRKVDLLSSENNTLTFKYEVQEGDSTSDLDYASSTALSLNGGLSGCVAQ